MGRALGPQHCLLFGRTHDAHQADAVLDADPVEHLAQVGGGRSVHQRGVAFASHGLGHAQRSERIHETRRRLCGRRAFRQHQTLPGLDDPVLRIHRAAHDRDHLAQQCLSLGRIASLDHGAGAFVADRHRLIHSTGHGAHGALRDLGRDAGASRRAAGSQGRQVGCAKQQSLIGRIDRGGLDANHDFIRSGRIKRGIDQGQFEFAAGTDSRAQLQSAAHRGCGHGILRLSGVMRSGLEPVDASCRAAEQSGLLGF